jgi:hypothetical protein
MNAELSERRVNSRRTAYHPFQLIVLALSVLPLTSSW